MGELSLMGAQQCEGSLPVCAAEGFSGLITSSSCTGHRQGRGQRGAEVVKAPLGRQYSTAVEQHSKFELKALYLNPCCCTLACSTPAQAREAQVAVDDLIDAAIGEEHEEEPDPFGLRKK